MWLPTAVLLAALQSTDPSAEGMKALEARKYEAAAQSFAKAVEADPKDYAARFHLALSYSLLNRDAEAVSEYRRVLELKPGLYEAQLNLGILLVGARQDAQAVEQLQAALAQKPNEFRPNYYLAEALLALGDAAAAEQRYKAALQADPKSAAAEGGLARAQAALDRLDEAAVHYRRAAELEPQFRDLLLELASKFEQKKRTKEAMELYSRFPDNAAARERLGELQLEAGQAADALPNLEAAVKTSPTAANRLALAQAYIRNKLPDKALPLLEQAVQAEPGNNGLRMFYGRALRDQKNFLAAAREFHRVAQGKPDDAEAWSELAGMLILLENYPQALAALDRVRTLGAETAAHLYFRAIVLDKTKQYKPALEAYEKFLAASQGKNPDEEFKARQRLRIIQKELRR